MFDLDWSRCLTVKARAGYLSGEPALRDDPRVSPETIIVNMDEGMNAAEVIETFGLRTSLADVQALYDYATSARVPSPV